MTSEGSTSDVPGRRPPLLGFVLLGVAAVAAGALALRHLGATPLPGCGLDSACERALAGPFGKLPLVDWPVAFAGTSFFAGLLAAWAAAREGWPRSLRLVARVGGVLSLAFLVLAAVERTPCPFCITAQLANLAFVVVSERARGLARSHATEVAFLFVLLATTGALALARTRARTEQHAAAEQELAESTRAIGAGGGARVFTGRYHVGPERAPLRLVLFTDYQCKDCARIESEAWALHEARSDLSLSIKHFPLCKDCNRRARELGHDPHPNACWAARAAEGAGIVGGDDAFWRMHRWLFAHGGGFTDADLRAAFVELALPAGPIVEAMHGADTLARVQADVEEALALGIQSTPTVFLNGVELRGWRANDALRRAVESLAGRAPAASGPELDHPPDALTKGLEDWRAEPTVRTLHRSGATPEAGALAVVLWSDYADEETRALDRRVRAFAAAHPGVRYVFRHYPLDPACVPTAPAKHPGACRAARAAEAARVLGGEAAFERFHAWLIERPGLPDDAALADGARAAGLDPAEFAAELARDRSLAAVTSDVQAARALGIQSIPWLYVAGKRVPRWRIETSWELLDRILETALESP